MDSAVREISSPVAARTLVKPRGETAKSYGYTGDYVPSRRRICRYVLIPSFAHHCLHVSSCVVFSRLFNRSRPATPTTQCRSDTARRRRPDKFVHLQLESCFELIG